MNNTNLVVNENEKIESFIYQFLSAIDVKENSKQTYKNGLKTFFNYLLLVGVKNISSIDVLNFKKNLVGKNLSTQTISSYLVAVKKFFKFLDQQNIYKNVAQDVKLFGRPKHFLKHALNKNQTLDLLFANAENSSIDTNTLEGKRNFALINLLVNTALRVGEVASANIDDIKQNGGKFVLYVLGKKRDNKDEFVVLTENVLKPIFKYLMARKTHKEKNDAIFVSLSDRNKNLGLTSRSISRIVKTRLREIGIDERRITAHSLRHTAITFSLNAGATIQEAQQFARHTNINTTLTYAHNIDRINNAPEIKIEKLLYA